MKPWDECSVVRDRPQVGGAKPAFCGTIGDDGGLSYVRPGELLRVRHCDLVPPLGGTLQNLSGPLARKLVPFWMAQRGQKLEKTIVVLHYPTFCCFSRKRQQI